MSATGTCDCCDARNVELSRSELAGLETWACDECRGGPGRLIEGVKVALLVEGALVLAIFAAAAAIWGHA